MKWEPDDKLHCTLKFLGDTPDEQVSPLTASLTALVAGRAPFDLAFGGLGVFPERGEPRIIWAGITGHGERSLHAWLQTSMF